MTTEIRAADSQEKRRTKEGRYLIAHDHEGTMGKRFPFTHWLFMGIGGSETAAP
jgi:hypothetical protein